MGTEKLNVFYYDNQYCLHMILRTTIASSNNTVSSRVLSEITRHVYKELVRLQRLYQFKHNVKIVHSCYYGQSIRR